MVVIINLVDGGLTIIIFCGQVLKTFETNALDKFELQYFLHLSFIIPKTNCIQSVMLQKVMITY